MINEDSKNNSVVDSKSSTNIKDVLIVDFVGTSPNYTAHFSDALNRFELETETLTPWNHSDLIFLSNLTINYASKRKYSASTIGKLLTYLFSWRWILKNSNKYKSIHFQWFPLLPKSQLDIFLIKKLLQKNPNLFFTVHNLLPHDNKSIKVRSNFHELYKLIPNLVVHSLKTEKALCSEFNIPKSKIIKINHGPMFSYYSNYKAFDESNKTRLGIVGFIKPYKGIELALEFAKMVKGTDYEFNLIIKGNGDSGYIDSLNKKITALELDGLVEISSGYLELKDYIETHNQLDGILAPYREIDQSGAIISALSLGKPILGFAVGGIAELIQNEVNGYLVTPNKIEDLIEGLKWLKKTDKSEIFSQCQNNLKSTSWENTAEILANYYV